MSCVLNNINDAIEDLLMTELDYNVEPEEASPLDWGSYPVALVDVTDDIEVDGVAGYITSEADFAITCFTHNKDRKERKRELIDIAHDLKLLIREHEQWVCNAIHSDINEVTYFVSTDLDHIGAVEVTFTVTYREQYNMK